MEEATSDSRCFGRCRGRPRLPDWKPWLRATPFRPVSALWCSSLFVAISEMGRHLIAIKSCWN